jgi:hypothetical protein
MREYAMCDTSDKEIAAWLEPILAPPAVPVTSPGPSAETSLVSLNGAAGGGAGVPVPPPPPSLPAPRKAAAAAATRNVIYMYGGLVPSDADDGSLVATDELVAFEVRGVWSL